MFFGSSSAQTQKYLLQTKLFDYAVEVAAHKFVSLWERKFIIDSVDMLACG